MNKLWRKFLAWLKSLKSSDDEPTNPQPDPVDPQPEPEPQECTCDTQYHYIGYRAPSSASALNPNRTGTYKETYRLYFECRQ